MKWVFTVFICMSLLTQAQTQDTLRLTLDEALSRGLAHDYDLRNQELNIQVAEKEQTKLNARRAPVWSAGGDLRTNMVLPVTIIPGSAFSNQGQDEGDRRIRFGTVFSISGALEANYALIDPSLASDRKVAQTQRDLQITLYEGQRAQKHLSIAEAWYDVFLQEEQLRLAAQKLDRARDLLEITQNRAAAGASLPADVLRSQLDVDNAAALREQAENQFKLSRQTLAYRIGLPLDSVFLTSGVPNPETPVFSGYAEPGQRWEIKEQQQRMALSELEVEQIAQRYKPSLNLYGNAALQHLSNDFAVWQNWFPLVYAGLQAKVTLSDGQLKRRNQEIAQLKGLTAQQNLEKWREDIAYEIAVAETAIRNAVLQWNNAQTSLAAWQRLFGLDRERYAGGKFPYSELLNTEYNLREAENNVLKAWYTYLVAKVRWEKAAGF